MVFSEKEPKNSPFSETPFRKGPNIFLKLIFLKRDQMNSEKNNEAPPSTTNISIYIPLVTRTPEGAVVHHSLLPCFIVYKVRSGI